MDPRTPGLGDLVDGGGWVRLEKVPAQNCGRAKNPFFLSKPANLPGKDKKDLYPPPLQPFRTVKAVLNEQVQAAARA